LTKTGLWSESAISIYFYDNKPLGSTGFVSRRLEGVKHVDLNGSVEKCVKLLMDEIEKTQLALEPIDDLEEKVVTDGRMPGIIETFEEVQEWLTGSSEIRFTKNDKHIDQVGLLCDGTDFIDVRLEGYRATIKNVRENSEKTVAGVTDIQAAIKDLAKASFSEAPNI
jgi:hypothetical protein